MAEILGMIGLFFLSFLPRCRSGFDPTGQENGNDGSRAGGSPHLPGGDWIFGCDDLVALTYKMQ